MLGTRVLIAALKPLANCLCPRCLVEKHQVAEAGTAADEERRANSRRTDDAAVHSKIRRARELVFKGYSLSSKRVKALLEPQSLTPIRVRSPLCFRLRYLADTLSRVLSPLSSPTTALIYTSSSLLT